MSDSENEPPVKRRNRAIPESEDSNDEEEEVFIEGVRVEALYHPKLLYWSSKLFYIILLQPGQLTLFFGGNSIKKNIQL